MVLGGDLGLVRARLFARDPFWASLASNLDLIEDSSVPTAETNGRFLKYNPEYVASLTPGQRETLLAHETAHCAMRHPWRVGGRVLERANRAADYVVNEALESSGYEPIPGWLRDTQYDGQFFERVYSKLASDEEQGGAQGGGAGGSGGEEEQNTPQAGGGNQAQKQPNSGQSGPGVGQNTGQDGNASPAVQSPGQGQGSGSLQGQGAQGGAATPGAGCPTGGFSPAPQDIAGDTSTGEPGGMSEADWEVAVDQAVMVSQAAGTMPGGLLGALQKAKEPQVDWVSETRDFLIHTQPTGQSWTTPNRKYIWQGLYLPGPKKDNMGPGVLAIDCSGSTSGYQKVFASEGKGLLLEAKPENLVVIYWDAKDTIPEEDVEIVAPEDVDFETKPRGYGGTVFAPVLKYVEENQINPAFMIVLTDLYLTPPTEDPGYPILWAVPDYCAAVDPPVGRVVRIPVEGKL